MKAIRDEDRTTIVLEGDLTSANLNDFRGITQFEIDRGGKLFCIDFAETEIIDSMGVGCLVATYNSIRHKEGTLKLINVPEHLHEILRIMHLDHIFTVAQEESGKENS
jgi:anti-anti-sigma factor